MHCCSQTSYIYCYHLYLDCSNNSFRAFGWRPLHLDGHKRHLHAQILAPNCYMATSNNYQTRISIVHGATPAQQERLYLVSVTICAALG